MAKVRSARGELVDFKFLAIKQQLASTPVPRAVEQRKQAIEEKDGVRTTVIPDADLTAAASNSGRGKQLNRK